nr:AF211540_1 Avr9/Cf-9 rapidly elicited protein 75 [Ipomoea batatas]GMC57256.1 AF211540_1 Avr9/Cf-9 rapidly elicited protein 75 [Ipomoea batatas]GMC62349.1 AF211540_1 Avr9/Cf-9 rapidly elicited protein 75 [Ipomoea batatas]GMC89543.1 AF211540_1 Avr9/Cf-9 rapidly elicited protein 75 [Ipomoea batatas]GME01830.1 AF211540_1 Avr9/Cf-9 rapidly elicited protein 75 [Ipomoea batatas]
MAWSEPESLCKTHPEHKQPAGVCSCCLRERLSKISGAVMDSSAMSISSSPAAANYNYSSASSSCSSGCVSPRGHRRITSDVAGRRLWRRLQWAILVWEMEAIDPQLIMSDQTLYQSLFS